MRAIGLDVGDSRIGVAAGDTETALAIPVGAIQRFDDSSAIASVIREAEVREAGVVVVGLPLSMSGRVGPQAESTQRFIAALGQATDLRIEVIDERLSTAEAERRIRSARGRGRGAVRMPKGASDAAAAALILQSWLDRPGSGL